MNLRMRKPPISIENNEFQPAAHKRFDINQLKTTKFNKVQ